MKKLRLMNNEQDRRSPDTSKLYLELGPDIIENPRQVEK